MATDGVWINPDRVYKDESTAQVRDGRAVARATCASSSLLRKIRDQEAEKSDKWAPGAPKGNFYGRSCACSDEIRRSRRQDDDSVSCMGRNGSHFSPLEAQPVHVVLRRSSGERNSFHHAGNGIDNGGERLPRNPQSS